MNSHDFIDTVFCWLVEIQNAHRVLEALVSISTLNLESSAVIDKMVQIDSHQNFSLDLIDCCSSTKSLMGINLDPN